MAKDLIHRINIQANTKELQDTLLKLGMGLPVKDMALLTHLNNPKGTLLTLLMVHLLLLQTTIHLPHTLDQDIPHPRASSLMRRRQAVQLVQELPTRSEELLSLTQGTLLTLLLRQVPTIRMLV